MNADAIRKLQRIEKMWNIYGFERGNLIMVVGGKQSVKTWGGGLRVKTQSKGEETEGVETEQRRKKEGERGDWNETKCMQT